MKKLINFLHETKRSVVGDEDRSYNGIKAIESEQTFYNKISAMYDEALFSMLSANDKQLTIIQQNIEEAKECQSYFDIPSWELLNSMLRDFHTNHNQSLKEDYDFLCFVRKCMEIQIDFLKKFENKISPKPPTKQVKIKDKHNEEISPKPPKQLKIKDKHNEECGKKTISCVEGLADYLNIGKTLAQRILNSEILQNNGIAYMVGTKWNINTSTLDKLVAENPYALKI